MNPELIYTSSGLDRQAARRTDTEWLSAQEGHNDMRVIPLWKDKNLVVSAGASPIPLMPAGAAGRHLLKVADTTLF